MTKAAPWSVSLPGQWEDLPPNAPLEEGGLVCNLSCGPQSLCSFTKSGSHFIGDHRDELGRSEFHGREVPGPGRSAGEVPTCLWAGSRAGQGWGVAVRSWESGNGLHSGRLLRAEGALLPHHSLTLFTPTSLSPSSPSLKTKRLEVLLNWDPLRCPPKPFSPPSLVWGTVR